MNTRLEKTDGAPSSSFISLASQWERDNNQARSAVKAKAVKGALGLAIENVPKF